MYHPISGRFMSEDPKGFAAGDPNLFRYVGNHPTYATDPSGLDEAPTLVGSYRAKIKKSDVDANKGNWVELKLRVYVGVTPDGPSPKAKIDHAMDLAASFYAQHGVNVKWDLYYVDESKVRPEIARILEHANPEVRTDLGGKQYGLDYNMLHDNFPDEPSVFFVKKLDSVVQRGMTHGKISIVSYGTGGDFFSTADQWIAGDAAHETGHMLGLQHRPWYDDIGSLDGTTNLMAPSGQAINFSLLDADQLGQIKSEKTRKPFVKPIDDPEPDE
jgi:hypothetical protein